MLRKPVPGPIFRWVKALAWVESAVFAGLLVVWLAPGMERATFIFGLAHGIGYIALCLLILYATVRRESPWPLLAASLTPVGPFGTLVGIELKQPEDYEPLIARMREKGISFSEINKDSTLFHYLV